MRTIFILIMTVFLSGCVKSADITCTNSDPKKPASVRQNEWMWFYISENTRLTCPNGFFDNKENK